MSKPTLQGARTLARAMLFMVTLSGCGGGDVVGPDEGVLFNRFGPHDIYRMNADGSGVVRLSDVSPSTANRPAWSPCGPEIAFNISELDGGWGIHVMDGDGSNVRRLTDDGLGPSWSPDCSKIAFWRQVGDEGQMDIWTINADGSGLMELTHGEGGGGGGKVCTIFECVLKVSGDSQPAWSPNGSEIAILRTRLLDPRGSEIHLIDLLGNAVQLTNGLSAGSPSWSPDGLRIAFTGGNFGNFGTIYVIGRDGSGLTEFQTNLQIAGVAWSPDGETIAFGTIGGSLDSHIYLFDIATSVVTRLTQPGSSNHHLSWSPDGSQAVFSSNGVE